MGNWIKIDRDIRQHWIWQDAVRLQWWMDLLMLAAWTDQKVISHGHVQLVRRGQALASVSFLASRWGRDRKTVMKFLQTLTEEGMIKRETTDGTTAIITICNYDKYQATADASADASMDASADASTDTIKERIRKKKKGEEERARATGSSSSSSFVRPSAEEVATYALEAGLCADEAAAFVDYYTACGWRVGRNAMKDWRAAYRSWVRRSQSSFKGHEATPPGMVLQGTAEKVYKGW